MDRFTMSLLGFVFALIYVVLAAAPKAVEQAPPIVGKVVAVADGDTLTVLEDKRQHKIRLDGIDAPERKQPYGDRSRQALAEMVFGRTVRVEVRGRDRYGRTIGAIWLGETAVNTEQVRRGWAWWYRQYAPTSNVLADAEAAARKARLGLWAGDSPIPPWEWRKQERERRQKQK